MTEDDDAPSGLSGLGPALEGPITRMKELRQAASATGRSITDAFAKGVVSGRRFDDVLRDMARRLAESSLKAALSPLQTGLSQILQTGAGALFGALGQSQSGAGLGNLAEGLFRNATPFADGGIVASPTFFGFGRNLGLMGERGAEAILPLARGPDGRLGVSAGAGGRPVSVTVNIATEDAASFRRSEAQVSSAIARAVARGRRSL